MACLIAVAADALQAARPAARAGWRLRWRSDGAAAAQLVEQHVDHRRGQQRQQLAGDQPADDGDAQRPAQLGAFAKADGQRQRAQNGGQRGHQDRAGSAAGRLRAPPRRADRPRARSASSAKSMIRMAFFLTMPISRKMPISAMMDKSILNSSSASTRAHAGRRQRRQHRQRVDQAFVQDAQHDVDHHQRRQDQQRLLALRLLRAERRAGKTAAHIAGQADGGFGLPDGGLRHR